MSHKPSHRRAAFGESALFLIAFAIMIGAMILTNRFEQSGLLPVEVAYMIKKFTTYLSKLGLVMVGVWMFYRFSFFHSIGREFQERFDAGWAEMSNAESTRWKIVIFLGLFLCATLLMLV
jgi:hypothetical protein